MFQARNVNALSIDNQATDQGSKNNDHSNENFDGRSHGNASN